MKPELEDKIRAHLRGDAVLSETDWKDLFEDLRKGLESPGHELSSLQTMLLEEEPDRPWMHLEAAQAERLVERVFPVESGLLPPRRGVIRQQMLREAQSLYGSPAAAGSSFLDRLWMFLKMPVIVTAGAAAGYIVAIMTDQAMQPAIARTPADSVQVAQLFPGYGEDWLGSNLEAKGAGDPEAGPLKVSLWPDRPRPVYESSDILTLGVKVSEACHLVLIERMPDAQVHLHPFWGSGPGSKLPAEAVHLYPGPERLWTLSGPLGTREIVAVATTRVLDPALCDALRGITAAGDAFYSTVREKIWAWSKESGSRAALHRVSIEVGGL